MKDLIIVIIVLICAHSMYAQLEVELRHDGIVVPRTTIGAVSDAVEGMFIYDTSSDSFKYFDGSTWVDMKPAFELVNGLVRQKSANGSVDNFIFGRDALPSGLPISGGFFFFHKIKRAFRGGSMFVDSLAWVPDSLGDKSFAYGASPKATGINSAAFGNQTNAASLNSVAFGSSTTASGAQSVAFGCMTESVGECSAAFGSSTKALGFKSTAFGTLTNADGENATAFGNSTTTNAENAAAFGNDTEAVGDNSIAFGFHTDAHGQNSAVFGQYNDPVVSDNASVTGSSPLFIVGNGNSGVALSNALIVRKDGNIGIGTNTPSSPLEISSNSTSSLALLTLHEEEGSDFARLDFTNASGGENWTIAGRPRAAGSQASAGLNFYYSDLTGNVLQLFGDGDATLDGTLTQNSDLRLKKDIHRLTRVMDKLENVHGYQYNWKDKQSKGMQLGLIAQEVQEAFPELVKEDEEGMLSVSYTNFTAVLLQAIKEQQDHINELGKNCREQQSQIDQQSHRMASFEKEIKALKSMIEFD